MIYYQWFFCTLFSVGSIFMDLKWEKVYNFWILLGWILSFILRMIQNDGRIGMEVFLGFFAGSFLPIVALFPLFAGKMIGTGDIKVLAVLGSMLGSVKIMQTMIWAFCIGAIFAIPILIFRCDWRKRIHYFWCYLSQILEKKEFSLYIQSGKRAENIHFTIPIYLGTIVTLFLST